MAYIFFLWSDGFCILSCFLLIQVFHILGHHRKPYIVLTCSLSFLSRSCFGQGQQFQSGIYTVISRLVTLRLLRKRRWGWNFFIFLWSRCNVSKSTCLTIDDPLFWCSIPLPVIPSQHFCGFSHSIFFICSLTCHRYK